MLGGEGVGHRERLVEVVDDDDLAVVAPRRAGEVPGRHARQDLLDVAPCTVSPSSREVVTRMAGESGPCSAWDSRSTATTNGVGAARRRSPGSRSARRTGRCRPRRTAAASPRRRRRCRARRSGRPCRSSRCRAPARPPPARRRAGRSRRRRPGASPRPSRPGSRRGSAACRRRPAPRRPPWRSRSSCAPTRSAGSGRRARRRRPTETGRCFWPRKTPGSVSTSKSAIEARCAWANRAHLRLDERDVVDHLLPAARRR